ncbi:MAG: type II CAAX endopeptidase family protein [Candidatus Thermoplasmatota archaeon]|jgi:membrane protease YdiL (CAAX protease family)|nr:type II CAAX endopeptidase family protein [Candidatus Thermoplasmatota archaeon]
MDFSIKKPTHVFALLVMIFIFSILYVLPVLSFLGYFPTVDTMKLTETMILFSSTITVLIFVGAPFVWYILVNRYSIRDMFNHLKLRWEGIDSAFLWGILAAIIMFVIVFAIGMILYYGTKISEENLSNIKELASNLSVASMFFVIIFQSISEEIFFRGFLFEKIGLVAGDMIAIFITAVLFGLAHISYGKIYPVVMPVIMGVFLGFIVVKTKNLYSAITAHMIFNLSTFILYLFAQSLS